MYRARSTSRTTASTATSAETMRPAPAPTSVTPKRAAISGPAPGCGRWSRHSQRAAITPAVPAASAMPSISRAGVLKMISPAAMAGSSAMPMTRSPGSVAGRKAARSSNEPALMNHELGDLTLSSRDPPESTWGL